jgi:hypothetical protein
VRSQAGLVARCVPFDPEQAAEQAGQPEPTDHVPELDVHRIVGARRHRASNPRDSVDRIH